MKVETKHIPISKIVTNSGQIPGVPRNARFIKDDRYKSLVKSIQDDPEMLDLRELIVFPVNGKFVTIAGNMRLRAMQELKFTEAPCKVLDKKTTAEKIRAYAVKDNIPYGEHDWELLANEWDVQELEDWGLEVEMKQAMEAQEDHYEIPDEIETDIITGDLFEIGDHRLLCGDATKAEDVARLMNGEKADMVTDPPYGIGIDGQKKSIAKNPKHNRKAHEFRGWDKDRPGSPTFTFLLSVVDDAIIWGGNYFADILPASRGWLYWSKGQDGNLSMSDGELAWTSLEKPLRSITVNRAELQGSQHPTQKPVKVIEFSINYLGNSDKPIADPFLGSGTTMVASHQLNRKCYGMEIDSKYCQIIIDRMLKLDPSLKIKKNGKEYRPMNTEKAQK